MTGAGTARYPRRRPEHRFRTLGANGRVSMTFPCETCGAADSRDEAHQRGCPMLPDLPPEEISRRLRQIVAAWAGKYL